VKADVARGARSPLDVLREAFEAPEGVEGRLRVPEFLTSIPAIGATKTARIMEELGIAASKRLGGLGRLQRRRLREFVADWVAGHGGIGDRLVVLAGPTAVGKGTVASYIRRHHPDVRLSVSATTRSPRPRRGRGRALLLRRRRRVRPHGRRRGAPRVGHRAQRVPLRHAAASGRGGDRRRRQRAARDRHPGCAVGAARDAEATLVFLCRRRGTNSCAGSSVAAPRARPSSSAASRPRRSKLAAVDEFDTRS
jgi:ribosomal protein S13